MAAAVEAKLDAVMHQPFAPQPLADPRARQDVDGALLEHAGAHPAFGVLAAAGLDHHRLDAVQVQQVREQQARGSCTDDGDLGTHARFHGGELTSSDPAGYQTA